MVVFPAAADDGACVRDQCLAVVPPSKGRSDLPRGIIELTFLCQVWSFII